MSFLFDHNIYMHPITMFHIKVKSIMAKSKSTKPKLKTKAIKVKKEKVKIAEKIDAKPRMNPQYEDTRLLVETFYDQQKTRQEAYNRIRTIVRNRLVKVDFREPEKKKAKEDKAYGTEWNDKIMREKIEKAVKTKKLKLEEGDYLRSLIDTGEQLKKFEKQYQKQILFLVKDEPIYTEYLSKIRGVAELTAANLIGYLGYCENFDTISKVWRYCGLAVFDGSAERKKKGEKIHYNPKLKTLMYKISDCFIKQGDGYRKLYDKFKAFYRKKYPEEIVNPNYVAPKDPTDEKSKGKGFKKKYTPMHIDLMTRRKVEKIFLANYYLTARKMKGLPVRDPYPMEYLKHTTMIKPFTDRKSKDKDSSEEE